MQRADAGCFSDSEMDMQAVGRAPAAVEVCADELQLQIVAIAPESDFVPPACPQRKRRRVVGMPGPSQRTQAQHEDISRLMVDGKRICRAEQTRIEVEKKLEQEAEVGIRNRSWKK